MYWLLGVGMAAGVLVTLAFESKQGLLGGNAARMSRLKSLTKKGEAATLDPRVQHKLARWVNGISNICHFWTGGFMVPNGNAASREQYIKMYEMLALLSALLLTVGVTYYTASDASMHLHGVLCCVANCALLLGTLMSTFFAGAVSMFGAQVHVDLLVGLFGINLMRGPMILFVIGLGLLYLEMVLWFKMTVDAGATCTLCLSACFTMAPLFFHTMHKMGWAVEVVAEEIRAESRNAKMPTPEDLQACFRRYLDDHEGICLSLDRDEFLALLEVPGVRVTSVQRVFAGQIFDAYVEEELGKFMTLPKSTDASRGEETVQEL